MAQETFARDSSPDVVAGEPLELEIDGEMYKVGRVRVEDIAAASARLRGQRIDAVLDRANAMDRDTLARAVAYAASNDPAETHVLDYMMDTTDGQVFVLWRCMRRHRRTLQLDHVRDLVSKEPMLPVLLFTGSGLSKPSASEDEQGADPPRTFGGREPRTTGAETPPCSAPSTRDTE